MLNFSCPSCAASIAFASPGNAVCPKCGKAIVVAAEQQSNAPVVAAEQRSNAPVIGRRGEYGAGAIIGVLIMLVGLFGVWRYWNLDATVPVDPPKIVNGRQERVHNIGLMDERRNGLLVSLGTVALGAYFVAMSRRT